MLLYVCDIWSSDAFLLLIYSVAILDFMPILVVEGYSPTVCSCAQFNPIPFLYGILQFPQVSGSHRILPANRTEIVMNAAPFIYFVVFVDGAFIRKLLR